MKPLPIVDLKATGIDVGSASRDYRRPFSSKREDTTGPGSYQTHESWVQGRGIFRPFMGPRRQVSGPVGVSRKSMIAKPSIGRLS